ncbi:GNAT family N-acetyltransferase [Niallia taxi]|uniref:GNAT family N-acetyltransferase n=1 Tax=Niallia taxi TaxID=2499688 RepID=UPI003D2E5C57
MYSKQTDFPVLQTERLLLREIQNEDALDIFEYLSDKDVMKYYGMEPFQSLEEVREEVEWYKSIRMKQTGIRWGITLKENGKVLGSCGFLNWDKRHFRTEIGYELHKNYWGQGLASEALKVVVQYGFEHMGLERIQALIEPPNLSSQSLLKKHGFLCEGLLRSYEFTSGKMDDLYMYSLIKKDFNGWRAQTND